MPISQIANGGGTIATGLGVNIFQLLAVKGAIRLEAVGLRHSSGRSVRKAWAVKLGLKPRAPAAEVIAAIEARIAELRAADLLR